MCAWVEWQSARSSQTKTTGSRYQLRGSYFQGGRPLNLDPAHQPRLVTLVKSPSSKGRCADLKRSIQQLLVDVLARVAVPAKKRPQNQNSCPSEYHRRHPRWQRRCVRVTSRWCGTQPLDACFCPPAGPVRTSSPACSVPRSRCGRRSRSPMTCTSWPRRPEVRTFEA